jgi:basic membrane lipoprotein Med (substrate-binding protein (PBP1-ABC) superfamily)
VSLAGCGHKAGQAQGGAVPPGVATTGAAKKLKVALLSPGPVDDAGWNASAYEGLKAIEKSLGAETAHAMAKDEAAFEPAFRRFAGQGYDIIFAHGNEYGAVAKDVAPQFPNTLFVISSGNVSGKNLISLNWYLEQATYLAGMLAASVSQKGKAGLIGGVRVGVVESTFKGFEQGAHAVKPSFQVRTAYVGSWEDASAAKKQAEALIAEGADVLLHNADAAGLGVFQAAQEHKAQGVLAMGSNRDQNAVKPEVTLASASMDIPRSFLDIAKERQQKGSAELGGPGLRLLGIDKGYVSLILNPALASRVPEGVRSSLESARQRMVSGALKVPRGGL